ncbi:MAG: TonB C-terminal domain-containing protein [Gammaproteobacteria bacterium]|nr:TonB C-terminal domain-containing protein [Gammaproteobacteria bacterium]
MDRVEPIILPVFFAALLHASILVLALSFSEPQGDGLFELEDLSEISVNARAVTLPQPRPVARPKPKPKPVAPVVNEVPITEKQLDVPDETSTQEDVSDEEVDEDAVTDLELPAQEASEKSDVQDEEVSASQRNEALAYYGRNRDLVERNFYAGTTAQREQFKGLVTRLKLYLDENGYLQKVDIVSGSGSALFDSEAIRAVNRVEKFIIPDDLSLRRRYFREITMEFNLDK